MLEELHRTADVSASILNKECGHSVNMLQNRTVSNYGVDATSDDDWRERHNAKERVCIKSKYRCEYS